MLTCSALTGSTLSKQQYTIYYEQAALRFWNSDLSFADIKLTTPQYMIHKYNTQRIHDNKTSGLDTGSSIWNYRLTMTFRLTAEESEKPKEISLICRSKYCLNLKHSAKIWSR